MSFSASPWASIAEVSWVFSFHVLSSGSIRSNHICFKLNGKGESTVKELTSIPSYFPLPANASLAANDPIGDAGERAVFQPPHQE